ncbi:MAG: hypothetical protein AAB642_04130, partial [Patescibacteria group bacterium]
MSPENGPERPNPNKVEDYLSDADKEKLRQAGLVPPEKSAETLTSNVEHRVSDTEAKAEQTDPRVEEIVETALQAEQQALKEADIMTQDPDEYYRRLRRAGDKALEKIDELTQGDRELKKAVLKRQEEKRMADLKRMTGPSAARVDAEISDEELKDILRQMGMTPESAEGKEDKGEQKETKTEQTDQRVEAAFKVYQDTLKETGSDKEAQDKAWGKLAESTGDDLDPNPFNKLAEKMEQSAQELKDKADAAVSTKTAEPKKDLAELSRKAMSDLTDDSAKKGQEFAELGGEFADTSRGELSSPPKSAEPESTYKPDVIIESSPAQKAAGLEMPAIMKPPENLPIAGGSSQTAKAETPESQERKSWREINKEEAEAAMEELNDTRERIEALLQYPKLIPADKEKLEETLRNLKFGLLELNKPTAKDEKLLHKTWQTTAEAERVLSDITTGRRASDVSGQEQESQTLDLTEQGGADIGFAAGLETAQPQTEDERRALQEIQPELEKMPEEEREKLGPGFNNLGFYIKKKSNGWLAEKLANISGKIEKEGSAKRFLAALAETFSRDAQEARQKLDDTQKGQTHKLSNIAYLTGSALKYGRTVADFFGWTAASPLRYVTFGAQVFGRGSEAIKEARLKNEEVINKTRIEDVGAAAEEAWKIYEAAQTKAAEKNEEKVNKGDLEKSYREFLPADLLKRLEAKPATGSGDGKIEPGVAEKVIQGAMKFHIEKSATHLQKQLDEIEKNPKLDDSQKAGQRDRLFDKYSRRLKDYDRVLSQWGTVDAIAMAVRYGETGSKAVVKGVMLESLYLSLDKMAHYLADSLDKVGGPEELAHAILQKVGLEEKLSVVQKLEKSAGPEYFQRLEGIVGITSKDGLDDREIEEIRIFADSVKAEGNNELAQKILGHYKLPAIADIAEAKIDTTGSEYFHNLEKDILGFDSRDGLDLNEIAKIKTHAAELQAQGKNQTARDLVDHYLKLFGANKIKVGVGEKTVAELLEQKIEPIPSSPISVETAKGVEPIPQAPKTIEELRGAAEAPQAVRFEDIIDSSKVSGSDSIWKSTREIFKGHAQELGYKGGLDDKAALDKWAENQTGNAVAELEKVQGGKLADLVHGGDKVVIDLDAEGKPHLKFEASSGLKPGYLPEREADEIAAGQTEQTEQITTDESAVEQIAEQDPAAGAGKEPAIDETATKPQKP